jgi:CubicO group peptidase (beta-lactamase class C family)
MKLRLILLILLSATLAIHAQTKSAHSSPSLNMGSAEGAGMSAERLERIDEMLKQAIEHNEIPGAVALVVRQGNIVYHKAFGLADNEAGRELKKDDIFRIASQTKAITSTAVMMLWEEGKFRLDDPISRYIPEFKDPQVLDLMRPIHHLPRSLRIGRLPSGT